MKQMTAIVIGAGSRGSSYAKHMHHRSDLFRIVGMAEPIASRRAYIRSLFDVPEENIFTDYRQILQKEKMADIAIIATMDEMHLEPALMAIEKGYHLLLEKPVAKRPEECVAIAKAAKEKGVSVLVCHVLRYTPFYKTVKRLLLEGAIGDVVSVMAVEGVGNLHQSHSFVRGNWRCEEETTPMLLAKCCHDLDIIQWLVDKPCVRVSSFGELTHFRPECAPEGAPMRCIDTDCPAREHCYYDVHKVYFGEDAAPFMRYAAAKGFSEQKHPSDEEVLAGLRATNYGACAYRAGNDVVDHQIVNMQFADGVTASLTMNAFNKGGRFLRIFGTKGELYAGAKDPVITVYSFDTRKATDYPVPKVDESIEGGHGGGDSGIIGELYEYLSGEYAGYCAANIDVSVKNHLIGFAAEKARRENTVESVSQYAKQLGFDYSK